MVAMMNRPKGSIHLEHRIWRRSRSASCSWTQQCGDTRCVSDAGGDAAKRDQQRIGAFLSKASDQSRTARRASSEAFCQRTCDPLGLGRAPTGFFFAADLRALGGGRREHLARSLGRLGNAGRDSYAAEGNARGIPPRIVTCSPRIDPMASTLSRVSMKSVMSLSPRGLR